MIELTEPLQEALDSQPDGPLQVVDPRTMKTYFLVSADAYKQMSALPDDGPDMHEVAALVERNMRESDAGDSSLDTREVFIQNVRAAGQSLTSPVEADVPHLNPQITAERWQRATSWLTPQSVEGFDPQDFSDLPPPKQQELRRAVDGFLAVAATVPPNAPATKQQVRKALSHFRRIVSIVQHLVLKEWGSAVGKLIEEAASWAGNQGWEVKRETKQLTDKFLGTYEVPELLIHTLKGRLLLDPVARYVVGATGLVDLCVLPSYDSVMIGRKDDRWYVYPTSANGSPQPWSERTFVDTVTELLKNA
jgi:hypothetical protein